MNYEIVSLNKDYGSLVVRFFTDDYPVGLSYSVDVPILEDGSFMSGQQLADHIMQFAPHGQIARIVAAKAANSSVLDGLVNTPPAPVKTPEQLAEEAREEAKRERRAYVDGIKVTTQAGNTFDGDETSQNRMARAIIALQATGTPTVTWVLADNSVIQATAAELTEALALAGAAQAAIWVIA